MSFLAAVVRLESMHGNVISYGCIIFRSRTSLLYEDAMAGCRGCPT